jgi:hypothetical protein
MRGQVEIQDRSKSKAARIKEEAKEKKASRRGSHCSSSSSEYIINVDTSKRKRRLSKDEGPHKSVKRFCEFLNQYDYNKDHGRGRIVVSQGARELDHIASQH